MFFQFLSFKYTFFGLVVAYLISVWTRRANKNRRLKRLGGRAPVVPALLPFGVDFFYYFVTTITKNKALEFWQGMFINSGAAEKNIWTAEIALMANGRIIITADPENIKAILTTQFTEFGKGQRFQEQWSEFLGEGIFTTDGHQWSQGRQLIRPMFVRERVGDLDIFEKQVQKLLKLIGPGDGHMVRIDKMLFRFTLDASTEFLLGRSVGSMEQDVCEFAEAFDEIQRVQSTNTRAGPFQVFMSRGTFRKSIKIMEATMEPYIDQALSLSPAELELKLSKSDTFIHSLARHTRDRKLMRDQIASVLLAGRDTTASTLSWVFLELARNPRVLDKLREEIVNTLGTNGRPPTYQEIKDMKYLTWILNETLRLYPIVPYNVRTCLANTTLPVGGGPDGLSPLAIEQDTDVAYSVLVMHRRRDLYPPISESFPYDPLEWVPDRWATWIPKSWQYLPFNGGPRICIGQQFAMIEMAYTLVRVLQKYHSMVDYGNKVVLRAEIVLTPGEGVKVGFCGNQAG